MWPFKKKAKIDPSRIMYSQLDITDAPTDNLNLQPDDWISTTRLNSMVEVTEYNGLPSPDADDSEVYRIASRMSETRAAIGVASDGVYCPVCNIANIVASRFGTPCPKCGRQLLKFGWD